MAASNDMKLNIKVNGDNRGFKNTLNQTAGELKKFEQKASGSGAAGRVAQALALGGGAFAAANTLRQGMNIKRSGGYLEAMDTLRSGKRQIDELTNLRNDAARNKNMSAYYGFEELRASARYRRREHIGKLKGHRDAMRTSRDTLLAPLRMAASGPGLAIIAGAVATLVTANAGKWAKRMNEATEQYSGSVISFQNRLEAKNMRKDIALARNPLVQRASMMRSAAADFRRNSGAGGVLSNTAGGAWDALVGTASNAIFGIPGLIMNIKGATESFGGIK
jgi:hypothetical protein